MALFGGIGRDEDVAGDPLDRPVGNQKAVAVAVHVEAADGEFAAARGDHIMARAQLQQVAARGQPGQRGFQLLAVGAFRSQFADQLLEVAARVRQARQVVEYGPVRHSSILLATDRGDEDVAGDSLDRPPEVLPRFRICKS